MNKKPYIVQIIFACAVIVIACGVQFLHWDMRLLMFIEGCAAISCAQCVYLVVHTTNKKEYAGQLVMLLVALGICLCVQFFSLNMRFLIFAEVYAASVIGECLYFLKNKTHEKKGLLRS